MPSLPPLAELAPGLSAAGALGPADIEALAASGVRTIVNNRPDNEDPGQLPAPEARRLAEAHGIAYHHIRSPARPCRAPMSKLLPRCCARRRSRWWRIAAAAPVRHCFGL